MTTIPPITIDISDEPKTMNTKEFIEIFFKNSVRAKTIAHTVSENLSYTGEQSPQTEQSPQIETVDNLEEYIKTKFDVDSNVFHDFKKIRPHALPLQKPDSTGHGVYDIFLTARVYLHTDTSGYFHKTHILSDESDEGKFSMFSLIREITLQEFAYSLWENECKNNDFIVPKIHEYSRKQIKMHDMVYNVINIKMEKLQLADKEVRQKYVEDIIKMEKLQLADKEVRQQYVEDIETSRIFEFYKKIKNFLDCLEKNGLYHNDTHNENINFVINEKNLITLALLDFGKATVEKSIFVTSTGIPRIESIDTYIYPTESERKQIIINVMTTWLIGRANDTRGINLQIQRYGGKKMHTRKYKKSRYQKKTNTHKKRKTRKSPI